MSVYTHTSRPQLEKFLDHYSIGSLKYFSGIQAGIENTNYAITSTKGKFILTLFESFSIKELPCYLELLNYLCQNNFPSPKPQTSVSAQLLTTLNNKPAALFTCLPGCSIDNPSINQCYEIGQYLAKLHLCTEQYHFNKPNKKNMTAWLTVFDKIKHHLTNDHVKLLSSELNFQSTHALPVLPQGTIHGDLFRDNVLFEKNQVSGILDFYNACTDYLLFDIAITINDWCIEDSVIHQQKFKALLSGYQKFRVLQSDEKKHLPIFLRRAALRFYLSRLNHQLNPKKGVLILAKDPEVFRQLLENHRTNQELFNDICLSTQ